MSCPICEKPSARGYRPFCSRRCADIDLGRWLTEDYRLPTEEEHDPAQNPPPPDRPLN